MAMPFTDAQFLEVFASYNESIWPLQVLLLAAAAGMLAVALGRWGHADRALGAGLAALWVWAGAGYHWAFFARINGAAYAFGLLFVTQGVLFAWAGGRRDGLRFRWGGDARGVVGVALCAYALVLYPLIGHAAGHAYPRSPTFGAPCPTTIFTFGLLMLARDRLPGMLLVVPVAWSVIATFAALRFGIVEDFGLLPAAILTVAFTVAHNRHLASGPRPAAAH